MAPSKGAKKKNNGSLIPIFADAWRGGKTKVVPKVPVADRQPAAPEVDEQKPAAAFADSLTNERSVVARKVGIGGLRGAGIKLSTPETLRAPKKQKSEEEIAAEWAAMNEPVTQERVDAAWKRFGEEKEAAEQFNLAATLQARTPVLEGMRIRFTVINGLQEAQVAEIRTELLSYLRHAVRNGGLELQVDLQEVEQEEVAAQFLSDKERYDAMVARHPLLDELRQRLDLDLS